MANIIYVIRRRTDLETSLATSYRDTRSVLAYTTRKRAETSLKQRYGKDATSYEIIEFIPKEESK